MPRVRGKIRSKALVDDVRCTALNRRGKPCWFNACLAGQLKFCVFHAHMIEREERARAKAASEAAVDTVRAHKIQYTECQQPTAPVSYLMPLPTGVPPPPSIADANTPPDDNTLSTLLSVLMLPPPLVSLAELTDAEWSMLASWSNVGGVHVPSLTQSTDEYLTARVCE